MQIKRSLPLSAVLASTAEFAGACAPAVELDPAPRANEIEAGPGEGAAEVEVGVRMVARVDAWNARPEDLDEEVTPVLVTISNGSTVPLRIRYNEFQLVSANGQRFAAMPPFLLEGEVSVPVTTPFFPGTGFEVAPYLSPFYPGISPFAGPFAADPLYYDTYFPAFREIELPTTDMLARALPEGVVAPGGEVTGFLYFQEVGDEAERVSYRAELVNALTGEPFGVVAIPFVERDS